MLAAGGIKSYEGTVCSVLAQALFVPLFMYLGKCWPCGWLAYVLLCFVAGVFRPTPRRLAVFAAAIVTNSVVEAKTDQIDNLVLPLITYAILTVA